MERFRRRFSISDPAFRAACDAVRRLKAAGFEAGLVGGSVRDLLLGHVPADFDLVTTAVPEQLAKLFPGSRSVGASFGVSLIDAGEFRFEAATAREERNYLDGRHPELVRYTDSLECDMKRRDFTVNALWYDPVSEEVCDCVGGVTDLERGILRTVGTPEERFREDYLRMLRAVRFAARLGLEPAPGTRRAISDLAPLAAELAPERIAGELTQMLTGPAPDRAMRLLLELGLLRAVLPEVAALDGVAQPPQFHPEGDVFTHTMLMLHHMVYPDARLAWSVLLHDIAKPLTQMTDETGRIRFFGHECEGAELAGRLLDRLRFSAADREAVVHAVRNHMRFASVREMRAAKLRRLLAEPNFSLELELHRLDCIASHGLLECFVFLLDELAERRRRGEKTALPERWVTGKSLISAGCRPGPEFGPLLELIYDRQLAGEFADPAEALAAAVAGWNRRHDDNEKRRP